MSERDNERDNELDDSRAGSPLEAALHAMRPAPLPRSASDAAFEAGRCQALAQQRQLLWSHRAASAAALLLAAGLGLHALTSPATPAARARQVVESRAAATPEPAVIPTDITRDSRGESMSSANRSPLSYLSLRSAMMSDAGSGANFDLDLNGLSTRPAAAPGDPSPPPAAPTVAELLREQRGL